MDKSMIAKILSPSLIIKNFVVGASDCNYENYLLELLNASNYFMQKYRARFRRPNSESNGECDAINDFYGIDFKLFASKTQLQAQSILQAQKFVLTTGVYCDGPCKVTKGNVKATRIFAAFRNTSYDELKYIRNKETCTDIEKDIKNVLVMFETKKNLLLFFPYRFSFRESKDIADGVFNIKEALYSDFHNAFMYRKNLVSQCDTYLTCLYDRQFLLFEVNKQGLKCVDIINSQRLPTFMKFESISEY